MLNVFYFYPKAPFIFQKLCSRCYKNTNKRLVLLENALVEKNIIFRKMLQKMIVLAILQ